MDLKVTVVPYIGTWIETLFGDSERGEEFVVPYIGTWIETETLDIVFKSFVSYLI